MATMPDKPANPLDDDRLLRARLAAIVDSSDDVIVSKTQVVENKNDKKDN